MIFTELAKKKIKWISTNINEDNIVLSSEVRLVRNLKDIPFPSHLNRQKQRIVFDEIVAVLGELNNLNELQIVRLNELEKIDRKLLLERCLISREHAINKSGEPGLIFSKDEILSFMVNEYDHLIIKCLNAGLSLRNIWNTLDELDDKFNKYLKFAYHNRFGYLTSCPFDAGTGMKASCILHLPGLVMINKIEKLSSGLKKIGLSIKGFYGEGSKIEGDIFQISNNITLGKTEQDIFNE